MRRYIFILPVLLGTAAAAQSAQESAVGLYGSALDPLQSCEINPHRLSFIENPPHAIFRWANPRPDRDSRLGQDEIYDLRGSTENSLTLLREGDAPLPETGRRPVWILRLTQNPAGYCWGREDWSPVRCIEPAIRCDTTPPSS